MSKTFKNRLKEIDFKHFTLSALLRVAYFLPSTIANLVESGTFASTVPALLPIRTACGSFYFIALGGHFSTLSNTSLHG